MTDSFPIGFYNNMTSPRRACWARGRRSWVAPPSLPTWMGRAGVCGSRGSRVVTLVPADHQRMRSDCSRVAVTERSGLGI
jgi:hypothetical protein